MYSYGGAHGWVGNWCRIECAAAQRGTGNIKCAHCSSCARGMLMRPSTTCAHSQKQLRWLLA
eukprot:6604382-Prymnesium_polylepis.1